MARKPRRDWDDVPTKEEMRQMNGVWAMEDIREERRERASYRRDAKLTPFTETVERVAKKLHETAAKLDKSKKKTDEERLSERQTKGEGVVGSTGEAETSGVTGATGGASGSTNASLAIHSGSATGSAWAPGGPYRYNINSMG